VLAPGVGIEIYTQERLATVFRLLMGAVSLLLLLSCANAGNLLLARVTGRRREIAVAHAIGASRFRIVRQQLVEGLVLSTAAGAVGLALAYALTQLFDGMRIIMSLPAVTGVGLDGRVLAFALGASLVTGVIFAAAPALVGSRVDLQSALKDGITTRRAGRRVLRASLVTVQVTVSVVLLVVAGLFVRTLQNIRSLDVGLRPDGLISFTVNPGRYGYTPERTETYFRDLLDRLRATPGVEQAAFSWTTSFSPNRADTTFLPADRAEKISAMTTFVSRGFFDTMRIPVIVGRDFTDAEVREANDAASAIVVSRRLAAALVPDGEALGAQVPVAYPKGKVVRIVGIAGDVRGRTMTAEPPLFAYLPEPRPSWGTIQVRSPLPAAAAIAAVRDVARAIDPLVLPADLERFDASIDRALAEQRLFARLSSLFAAIAAVLAGIGIYAMMAGAVSERRREFGIRVALGAPARAVLALVLRHALVLAGIGALLGIGGAIALRRILETRLYGVPASDPFTIAVAVTALIAVALAAGLVPGLRATRVDPVRSLRVD
jgi:predicted permease